MNKEQFDKFISKPLNFKCVYNYALKICRYDDEIVYDVINLTYIKIARFFEKDNDRIIQEKAVFSFVYSCLYSAYAELQRKFHKNVMFVRNNNVLKQVGIMVDIDNYPTLVDSSMCVFNKHNDEEIIELSNMILDILREENFKYEYGYDYIYDRYINDLSIEEMSTKYNTPEGTIKRRLHTLRHVIQKELEESGITKENLYDKFDFGDIDRNYANLSYV